MLILWLLRWKNSDSVILSVSENLMPTVPWDSIWKSLARLVQTILIAMLADKGEEKLLTKMGHKLSRLALISYVNWLQTHKLNPWRKRNQASWKGTWLYAEVFLIKVYFKSTLACICQCWAAHNKIQINVEGRKERKGSQCWLMANASLLTLRKGGKW